MIADLNVHWDMGADGMAKPHAHVMLTMREVGEEGFGAKVRDWNATSLLEHWREAWAEHANARLAELDIDARVDHRSLDAQGIDLEPQHKIGPAAARMVGQGLASERLADHHAIARSNGEKIIACPGIALDAITHTQATAGKKTTDLVFPRPDGKSWSASQQARPISEACRNGKVERATFHDLRRTFGARLARKGVPMAVIAEAMGHADERITRKHYAHLAPSYVADTVRAGMMGMGIVEKSNLVKLEG